MSVKTPRCSSHCSELGLDSTLLPLGPFALSASPWEGVLGQCYGLKHGCPHEKPQAEAWSVAGQCWEESLLEGV